MGMKIQVSKCNPISKQGLSNLHKALRNKSAKQICYKPLTPVLFANFEEINTGKKIASFIYSNFGASEDGTTYRILYWRAVNHWSRRFARLCMFKVYDLPDGQFKWDPIDMRGISRFGWFKK